MRTKTTILWATLALLPVGPALARPPAQGAKTSSPEASEAKEHYLNGRKLFDLTKYDEAIDEFEAAYKAKPDPVFLYNIAQAHRLAGHLDKAVRFYRNYLRLQPDSPQRSEIERRIDEIDQAIRTQQGQQVLPPMGTIGPGEHPSGTGSSETPSSNEPPASTTPTTPPAAATAPAASPEGASGAGRTLQIAGIVTAVAGVALVGVGLGLGIDSLGARDQYAHPAPNQVYDPTLEQRANVNDVVAITVGTVGVVAAAAGVVLLVKGLRDGRPEAHARLTPVVGPTRAGAALSLTF